MDNHNKGSLDDPDQKYNRRKHYLIRNQSRSNRNQNTLLLSVECQYYYRILIREKANTWHLDDGDMHRSPVLLDSTVIIMRHPFNQTLIAFQNKVLNFL